MVRSVSEKSVHDRQRGNLPCTVEEVMLYLGQEISALSVAAVTTEIMKRVEMGTVMSFVAPFAPIGLFPRATRPLLDAAFDLMTTGTTR